MGGKRAEISRGWFCKLANSTRPKKVSHLFSSNDTTAQEDSEQKVGDEGKIGSVVGRVSSVGSLGDEVDEGEPGDEGPLRREESC